MSEKTNNAGKKHRPSKRQFLILIPFALLYTIFIIFGNLEKASELSAVQNIGRILLCMIVSYAVLFCLCFLLSQITLLSRLPAQKRRERRWYVFAFFFLICLICYIPYFLMYYPTWFNNDAVWQMKQILGLSPKSNHHPYFHTMIIQFFFTIGYRLFGTYTDAIAFYSFWQIVIMALVFAFLLYQLYKRGTRLVWLVLALVFYAVLPVNAVQTLCMGKDEFFSAALLLFIWMTAESAFDEKKMSAKSENIRHIICFATGLLVCLLRSNGIFIFFGTAFISLLFDLRKNKFSRQNPLRITFIKKHVCALLVLLCYFIYHGPILNALQAEPPDTIEGLTMPTQHILCAYLKGGELTEEEIAMIDRVVPADKVGEYYNPYLFDIVKAYIREEGNQQVIEDEKWEYFKLWFRVGLRNPLQYMVAEVRQTMGYWAYRVKDYQYLYSDYFMVENPFGVEAERKFFTYDDSLRMDTYLKNFQDIFNKVWSLGLTTWLMLFALAYAVYDKRTVMPYIPCIMLLVTLLLATPVYNEFRYTYGIFAALPLLLSYSLGYKGESNEEMV